MSNDLPKDGQARVLENREQISQLSPEGERAENESKKKESVESLGETTPPEEKESIDVVESSESFETIEEPRDSEQQPIDVEGGSTDVEPRNIVDKTTGKKETEPVEETSHNLTKDADDKEKDFIEHVERVHTII